jgi:hypothetical protein
MVFIAHRELRVWALCTAVIAVLWSIDSKPARANVGELTITLEDTKPLEYQTIYMIISFKNLYGSRLVDVAPLNPSKGFLRLQLFRLNGSEVKSVPMHGRPGMYVGLEAGISLGAGETEYEVRDLLTYFGGAVEDGEAPTTLGWRTLQPGKYRLSCTYEVFTGFSGPVPLGVATSPPAPPQVTSVPIEFEVRPLSSSPGEVQRLKRLFTAVEQSGADRSEISKRCREALPQFYESPFLLRVFRSTGSHMASIPIETLLRGRSLTQARRAAIFGVQVLIDPSAHKRDPHTFAKMRSHAKSEVERGIIASWERSSRVEH